jgi:hypothetical protein
MIAGDRFTALIVIKKCGLPQCRRHPDASGNYVDARTASKMGTYLTKGGTPEQ